MKAKKLTALLLASAMAASMVAGCSSGSGKETEAATAALQETEADKQKSADAGWTGEITFFAKEYTPAEPNDINPNPPKKLREYADEYEQAHPGVTIKFVELPGDVVMNEYIRTQAAAKQLPDITFINYAAVGSQLPKEMFGSAAAALFARV